MRVIYEVRLFTLGFVLLLSDGTLLYILEMCSRGVGKIILRQRFSGTSFESPEPEDLTKKGMSRAVLILYSAIFN